MGQIGDIARKHLTERDIPFNNEIIEKIEILTEELIKWNRIVPLVSGTDMDSIVSRHVMDSISGFMSIDHNHYSRIADIGSGNGFPGIIIGLFFPDKQVVLIENRRMKASFLKQACFKLYQANTTVYARSAARYDFTDTDIILARAFGSIDKIRGYAGEEFSGTIGIYRKDRIELYVPRGTPR
ncbi:MAG: 16S rRNA (guanine(527)-N(7))-methyltransferase RsmG [candidate division WOR-3 bacterium]|nr:16S rRNA (guanine(527)-N(7))-methyltransferase RsmG [candidate division WOR-3 bacterium]